jgi:hypothetical protein
MVQAFRTGSVSASATGLEKKQPYFEDVLSGIWQRDKYRSESRRHRWGTTTRKEKQNVTAKFINVHGQYSASLRTTTQSQSQHCIEVWMTRH